jgi:hypothetical protein
MTSMGKLDDPSFLPWFVLSFSSETNGVACIVFFLQDGRLV